MNASILDTDILSEVLKARNELVAARARTYHIAFGKYSFSCISVVEVVRGYQAAGQPERLRRFLDVVAASDVISFTSSDAILAGQIDGDLMRTGFTIGRADPMIAATAIGRGLVLVTGNTAHFQRICDLGYALQLDNWRSSLTAD